MPPRGTSNGSIPGTEKSACPEAVLSPVGVKILYCDDKTLFLNNNMRSCEVLLTIDDSCCITVDNVSCYQEITQIAFSVDDVPGAVEAISASLISRAAAHPGVHQ